MAIRARGFLGFAAALAVCVSLPGTAGADESTGTPPQHTINRHVSSDTVTHRPPSRPRPHDRPHLNHKQPPGNYCFSHPCAGNGGDAGTDPNLPPTQDEQQQACMNNCLENEHGNGTYAACHHSCYD